MKITKSDVKIFIKTVAITSLCMLCFTGAYLSCCNSYEAMRETLFDDTRKAVIISEEYVKFFDYVIYF